MELKQMVCSRPLAKMAVQGWEGPERAEPEGIFSEKSYQGKRLFIMEHSQPGPKDGGGRY